MPTATESTTETLTQLLSHLIRFPTVSSDRATNRAAIDWVEQQLEGLPLHITRLDRNGFPALIATTKETKNPKLWLTGHMDVVPGAPETFNPTVRDGRLHGRGTHDMKFALAVFIALLQELGSELTAYDLGLMITSDEEVGGYDGVKWLLDEQGYRGDAVLVPDCNGTWSMEMGSKGVMWWQLSATGRSSHASRPWEGINAIDQLTCFVDRLRSHMPKEPCGDPKHEHATINFGTISGGEAANQVPDYATGRVDIRFLSDISIETITSWMDEAKLAFPGVEAKALLSDPPYKVDHDGPTTVFEHLVKDVTGHGVTLATAHGSSDARHFARHNIPTVNITPSGGGYHVPDEWIDLADLDLFYEVTRRFAAKWAGPEA